MVHIDRLTPADRADWQVLFEGYNSFYERTLAPELFDRAWTAFQEDNGMYVDAA
ncbi:hypothetical protein [Embleya sp. NPDC005575]|uniref:hypothetical protein n=1 Tax=Embleya sp. NPDC005575 TaxID=3156892 RepID=UPI0033AFD327